MIEPPLEGLGPKPYSTTAWTYSQVVEEVEDEADDEFTEPFFEDTPQPYATKAWTYHQTFVEVDDSEPDDDTQGLLDAPWWETIGDSGPSPYATRAWSYFQVVVEDEVSAAVSPVPVDHPEWWETIGEKGPFPYATASWTYHQEVSYELEFVPISLKLFFAYDEEFYPRTKGLGIVLDSGYFGQVSEAIYDSAYYLGGERGILMKRKLARVLVYDQRADSPGSLPSIQQPIGVLATDPNFGDPLETDPIGDEIGAELNNVYWASINADTGPQISMEIAGDGVLDGVFIEAERNSRPYDDVPPGTLLGSVSYELFGTTVTITDWEHLNWQDDTPVYKAVKVILNELPSCVTEVKVLDPPHAFWTALGFTPNYKGDQYLHLYTE